jgi:hypothetical protein
MRRIGGGLAIMVVFLGLVARTSQPTSYGCISTVVMVGCGAGHAWARGICV